jgi:hypothetical protein
VQLQVFASSGLRLACRPLFPHPALAALAGVGQGCHFQNYLGSGSLLVKRVGAVANALADAEVSPTEGRAA